MAEGGEDRSVLIAHFQVNHYDRPTANSREDAFGRYLVLWALSSQNGHCDHDNMPSLLGPMLLYPGKLVHSYNRAFSSHDIA